MPEISRGGRDAEIRVRELHNVQRASGLEKAILAITLAVSTVLAVVAVRNAESKNDAENKKTSSQAQK